MVSPSNSGKSSWTMILLGALGAGKSTIVNILNSKNTNANRVEFVASNSFKGFTKDFVTDVMPMSGVGIVKLIDSPGLADPNIPIDQWVKKYNLQLKGEAIDLVVCLIEYAERPSTKELQVFAFMNQALATIKSENLVVVFNKCPPEFDFEDANDFYNECSSQLDQAVRALPRLSKDAFKVLYRKGAIKKNMQGETLINAQKQVSDSLSEEVSSFLFQKLLSVTNKFVTQQADRKKIAAAIMDEETKKNFAAQEKRYEQHRDLFEKDIADLKNRHEELLESLDQKTRWCYEKLNEIKQKDPNFIKDELDVKIIQIGLKLGQEEGDIAQGLSAGIQIVGLKNMFTSTLSNIWKF